MKTWILILSIFGSDYVGGGIYDDVTVQQLYFKSKETCMYAGNTYLSQLQQSGVSNKANFLCVPQ